MKNELTKRIVTGFVLLALLIPAILLGNVYYLVLTTVLIYFAGYEMTALYTDKQTAKLKYFIPLASCGIHLSLYFVLRNNDARLLLIPATIFIFVVSFLLMANLFLPVDGNKQILGMIFGMLYGGVMLSLAFHVEYLLKEPIYGIKGRLFIYLYGIVLVTDTFAYLFGSRFGKHPFFEKISPAKTMEGAVAGLVFGTLIGTAISLIFDVFPVTGIFLKILFGIFTSLLLAGLSQMGDLIASKFKREHKIKDYGFIFPGHGGVMDRFDSLILAGSSLFILYAIGTIL